MPLKVLDLFAGCGGLSHGFQMAGCEIVVANDKFEEAAKSHQLNHPDTKFVLGNITDPDVSNEIIRAAIDAKCDVIVGGPPCQAYSLAGRRNVDDDRGRLFENYVSIVKAVKPAVFVMENVKGILTMRHNREDLSVNEKILLKELSEWETRKDALQKKRKQAANSDRFQWTDEDKQSLNNAMAEIRTLKAATEDLREAVTDQIVRAFKEIGYEVQFRLLNAADFGVAQKRERVVFVGTRLPIDIQFPTATHRDPSFVQKKGASYSEDLRPWKTTREAIDDLEKKQESTSWSHIFTAHKPDFVERLRDTPVGGNVYKGFSDSWYKQPPNEPSRTVKENHGGVFVHYSQARVMTPRELARLQSFPDDFLFSGSKSKILVQIGNAVPPLLGKAIAISVKEMLEAR